MSGYRFVTRFVVSARVADVFAAALEPELWLPDLDHVLRLDRIEDGDQRGVGRVYDTEVGAAPYRLRWAMQAIEVVPDVLLAWDAKGDLSGRGSWTLSAVSPGTLVISRWDVRTSRLWMRALKPVARPLFVRNHDRVMRSGAELLAAHVDADLVSFSTADETRARSRGRGDRSVR